MSPRFSCWGWGTWADRWNRIASALQQNLLPYSAPEEIPNHAGDDLPASILKVINHPDHYWDYPIALHCLRNNWFHAITNYYLTNNIGQTSGDHAHHNQKVIQFMQENNTIDEKVPVKFSRPEANPIVDVAVRTYLSAIKKVAIRSQNAPMTNRQKAQRAVSKVKKTLKRAYHFIKKDAH
jgi:hypothetical protein